MITSYDITAVVFYFLFMVGIAFAFKKQITDTSEYFRGGGKMLWWMCGASAFMSTFSAWTFSGAAGKAYVDGFPVIIVFLFNIVAYFVCASFFAHRFRQLRVITPNQAIRQRFGKTSEQVFTWFKVISAWNTAALSLIAVSVFMSAVLGLEQSTTIILTGVVIIFMSVVGGSWAVIASDFVQCLLVLAVSFVTFLYAYNAGGGATEIINNFPGESFIQGNGINHFEIFLLWIAAICLQRVIGVNSLSQSVRFLSAKDSNHARKAAILAGVLFLFGSIMWFLPQSLHRQRTQSLLICIQHLRDQPMVLILLWFRTYYLRVWLVWLLLLCLLQRCRHLIHRSTSVLRLLSKTSIFQSSTLMQTKRNS